MSSCLGRAAVPVKRVWRGLSARLGRRCRSTTGGKLSTYAPVNPDHDRDEDDVAGGVLVGLGRLRKDVRSCEYRDVHVMWEMLSSNGGGSCREDIMAGVAVAGKCSPAAATKRRTRRRGRKPAPWVSRLVAYCCAFC